MALSTAERSQLLDRVDLFAGLGGDPMQEIADRAIEVHFPAERTIARQGEIGTGFFLIVRGRVRVVHDGQILAQLGPGEFFGELSLLDQMPRIASVVAQEPTTCLAIASWDFDRLLLEQPSMTVAILRTVARRLRAVTDPERH